MIVRSRLNVKLIQSEDVPEISLIWVCVAESRSLRASSISWIVTPPSMLKNLLGVTRNERNDVRWSCCSIGTQRTFIGKLVELSSNQSAFACHGNHQSYVMKPSNWLARILGIQAHLQIFRSLQRFTATLLKQWWTIGLGHFCRTFEISFD